MRLLLLSALAACCLLACTSAGATPPPASDLDLDTLTASAQLDAPDTSIPVVITERVWQETYAVRGRNPTDLRDDLNRNGVLSIVDNRRYDALSAWSLKWSFRYARGADSCSLAGATIEISVAVRLPDLANPDELTPRTLAAWQTYRDSLEGHEMGHVDRQLDGAAALKTAFQSIGALPSCGELGATLNALGEAQIAAGRLADRRYDDETDHGRSQGAVFP